jgi:hypothetical protein
VIELMYCAWVRKASSCCRGSDILRDEDRAFLGKGQLGQEREGEKYWGKCSVIVEGV